MKNICIYCGSSPGAHAEYQTVAREVGAALAKNQIGLVYGGGRTGLMGIVADAALKANGNVIGIIPEQLVKMEVAHNGLSDLRVVGSMHERKQLMSELSDGFIALPGGIGTAEEILEAFTWMQLGIHLKPCGILNLRGYYDGFIMQFNRMVEDRFLLQEQLDFFIVDDSIESLIKRMSACRPKVLYKWVDKDKPVI